MSEMSHDPFKRLDGNDANVMSRQHLDHFAGLGNNSSSAYSYHTVQIVNQTCERVCEWDHLGVRTTLAKHHIPYGGTVRIEYSYKARGGVIDPAFMTALMKHIPPEKIMSIFNLINQQVTDMRHINTFHLYWEIPVEMLRENPNGILISPLGRVIQLYDPETTPEDVFTADTIPELCVGHLTGIQTHFNKLDKAVKGCWVNLKGTNVKKICDNDNDPALAEGLTVVMNGKSVFYPLDEMAMNGFFMSPITAVGAHAITAAEANQAHKQFTQDNKEAQERAAKEEATRYERTVKEDDRQFSRENTLYDREFREREREIKIDDKTYDREQILIDKTPSRQTSKWQLRFALVATAVTAITGVLRLNADLMKVYSAYVGE